MNLRALEARNLRSLTLATAIMTLAVAGVCRPANADQKVYQQVRQSSVWIVNGRSSGSGVVVDVTRRLVVTNKHVVGSSRRVLAFAPVKKKDGKLWTRSEYLKNKSHLIGRRLATYGRVIAESSSKDLAIVQLNIMPRGLKAIPFAPKSPEIGSGLHIVGNPTGRPLFHYSYSDTQYVGRRRWSTTQGQKLNSRVVSFYGGIWFGNSGGAVANGDGQLVGIASTKRETTATAIHVDEVRWLLKTVRTRRVFGIRNNTKTTMPLQIRYGDGKWKSYRIRAGRAHTFWATHTKRPHVRFDSSTVEGYQERKYRLHQSTVLLGTGGKPSFAVAKRYKLKRKTDGSGWNLFSY